MHVELSAENNVGVCRGADLKVDILWLMLSSLTDPWVDPWSGASPKYLGNFSLLASQPISQTIVFFGARQGAEVSSL